ncbi:MAG: hypothetical protein ACJAS1_002395 [Oleiphilaceae bacterium]|jgi:hypothetical protein
MKYASFNIIQKISVTCFITLVVSSTFLSNPLSGYIMESKPIEEYAQRFRSVTCTSEEKEAMRARYEESRKNGVYDDTPNADTDGFINSMVALCSTTEYYKAKISGEMLPFSQWRSVNPVFYWFGFVSNIVQLVIAAAVVCGVVFLLFKKNDVIE